MNAERLIELWDRIADAPDAVTRLRRFILDLAVRGKLVPQDPADEPASELLKRIVKGTSSIHPPQPRGDGTVPEISLPHSWLWVRIGAHLELLNGMAFKPTDWVENGLRIVRIQNLNRIDAAFNYCRPEIARDRALINDGSILISWSGTPGTSFGAFIWDRGPAVLNQHIFRCDLKYNTFNKEYLRLAINGRLDEMISKAHGGVGLQHITKGKLEALLIALPPLAEQHRIVAKVDELMTLCDRLEAARETREKARDRFAAAGLARLRAPDADPATFADHARFAIENLAALTTRPDQIKALRQTILDLAVRGKLVRHDPNEEPASELLKRLRAARQKTRRAMGEFQGDGQPFGLPVSWCWTALGELITDGPQNGISPQATTRLDAPKAITLTATTSGAFDGSHFKRVDLLLTQADDYWLRDGDLLFQRGNTREYVGMAAIYSGPSEEYIFPDLIMRVRVSPLVSLRYVHLSANSPMGRAYMAENASGAQLTMPKINQTTLLALPIPLPSLAEQHRIVAKVDALMALCDHLEASLTAAAHTRRRLLDALIAEALAPTPVAAE